MPRKSLPQTIWETVHKSKLSVPELADEVGCSVDTLYKTANVNMPAELKVSWLIPLIRATGNASILKHIATRLGYVLVRVPRARRMKPEEIADHQRTLADYQAALIRFNNGELNAEEVHEIVDKALTEVARAKKMVEADTPQQSLFENDD